MIHVPSKRRLFECRVNTLRYFTVPTWFMVSFYMTSVMIQIELNDAFIFNFSSFKSVSDAGSI